MTETIYEIESDFLSDEVRVRLGLVVLAIFTGPAALGDAKRYIEELGKDE